MASVLPDHKLSKSKFLNWIKAALAVHFTKEEIEPVVQDEIEQFQRRCLQDICTTNGLPAGSICTTCNTENVIVCPTDRICNAKRGKCKYHRNFATQYRPSGCPNKICHHMKSEIQKAHRFHGPSYKNTDATKWCNDIWEIAKCFLPPDGYTNVSSAAETDFNGIISVIINHKEFEAKIKDDLSKKGNIFDKGRDVGKAVRHSPNLEVEDTELAQYLVILNDILTDPGFVVMNKSSYKAIQKLTKLQTDDLIIGKDVVRKVLEDVGKAIQEQIRFEMDEYKYKNEEQKLELIDIVNLKVKDIEDKGNVSLSQLNDTLKSCVDAFDARVQKSIQEIDNQTEKGKQKLETIANEVVKKVTEEAENVIKEVQKAVEQRPSYNDANAEMSEETYQKRKEELKEDLVEFYKWNHSKVLLSPLFEEKDTPMASFYIRPELSVKTLQDMFKTEGVTNQEIYLKADAGIGKTTFSKYLATTWYQAHCTDEKDLPSFEKKDIDCMRDFDFVFLVLLRDSNTSCFIDGLIFKLIVSNLEHSNSFTEDFLQELLCREKCLVILDGLDEWTHPKKKCEGLPRLIPHRKVRKKCTVLTTTRPWKLGNLNLSSNELGRIVELTKLSYNSAVTMIKRTLLRLKSPPHNISIEIDEATLVKEIFNSRVAHLAYVPLLLMYMICLRCEGFNMGNSKCELYVKIVELLLFRTTQKYGDISQTLSSGNIPACFAEHDKCKEYFPLLVKLGQLAYQTLSKTTENTLVFDESVTKTYLTPEEMNFTLHSGILSQSTTKMLTKKLSKVLFSHKTVQEFFSAIFISSQSDAQTIVLEKCRNIQDILDMSKLCEFICEMNVDRMCAISNDLMSVINEDMGTHNYRTRKGGNFFQYNPLYDIQKMFMSFLQEMSEIENIQLCLQDFFIDKYTENSEQLQRLLKQNKTNIKSLFINTINISSSLREIIDLFSLSDLSHIQKLIYLGDVSKKKEVELNRILLPSLQNVTLFGGKWTNYEGDVSENLTRVQNLQYLYIEQFNLSHKILEPFFNFISGQKSMKELKLKYLDCTDHVGRYCKRLNLDLSQHSTLSKLYLQSLPRMQQLNISTPSLVSVDLSGISLDESSLLSRDLSNINYVHLSNIEMSADSLRNFITVLENLQRSVRVYMEDIKPETEYERVRKYIRKSQKFYVKEDNRQIIWFEKKETK